ncbi:MAG: hypothetical protein IPN62_02365 [Flavobacteriales bacterium]|nr:hypothetical protein [Flavobacteriales bacterium]
MRYDGTAHQIAIADVAGQLWFWLRITTAIMRHVFLFGGLLKVEDNVNAPVPCAITLVDRAHCEGGNGRESGVVLAEVFRYLYCALVRQFQVGRKGTDGIGHADELHRIQRAEFVAIGHAGENLLLLARYPPLPELEED